MRQRNYDPMDSTNQTATTPAQPPSAETDVSIGIPELTRLCHNAILHHGGSPAMALSLAAATVHAEMRGKRSVGVAHLFDYLDALTAGRIDGFAEPAVHRPHRRVRRAGRAPAYARSFRIRCPGLDCTSRLRQRRG